MVSMCLPFLLVLTGLPQATDEGGEDGAAFAEPVRLFAGDAPMGQGRMYPSPALYDLDGDGVDELILGDLFGALTVCRRQPGDLQRGWSEASALDGASGEPLRFDNW